VKVTLGVDHAGFPLKEHVRQQIEALGHEVIDCGTDSEAPVDFPDIVEATCSPILQGTADRAVLVCGSGVGAVMAANKMQGIRCALAHEPYSAHQSVEHDDANVIAMGNWLVAKALIPDILQAFFDARFDDDDDTRRRVAKMHALETRTDFPRS
jgi:ribose 5-phosphate isomerase B